jgi:hypothetical protein
MARFTNIYHRFRKLTPWSKLAVIASLCTILTFVIYFLSPHKGNQNTQQIVVNADTATTVTVLQSGRDIIVNGPLALIPKERQSHKEIIHQSNTRGRVDTMTNRLSQTIINSPGSIQAGGNVTISSDRRLISTLQLLIRVQSKTPTTRTTDAEIGAGLGSIVALLTKDSVLIRFASDFMITDQQVTPTLRCLSFRYAPENPKQILGQPVDFLVNVEALIVNYAMIFKTLGFNTNNDSTWLKCTVLLNGVDVAELSAEVNTSGTLSAGEAIMNVSQSFAGIPARYAKTVGQ